MFVELLGELRQEIIAGNQREALALANDAIENNVKINQHGKREDGIVKAHSGELQVESNEGEGSVFTLMPPIACKAHIA